MCCFKDAALLKIVGGTLPETNSLPLKMDGWKMNFISGQTAYFSGCELLVSGRVVVSTCFNSKFTTYLGVHGLIGPNNILSKTRTCSFYHNHGSTNRLFEM